MRARGSGGGRACAADKSVGAAGAGLCVCACESATSRKKSCIPGVARGATPARGAEGDTEASVLKRGADPAAKRAAPGFGCSCVACPGPSPRRGDPYKAAIFAVNTAQLA